MADMLEKNLGRNNKFQNDVNSDVAVLVVVVVVYLKSPKNIIIDIRFQYRMFSLSAKVKHIINYIHKAATI